MTYDRRADLSPALGYPGGPCQVVQRINKEIRNPKLRDQLIDDVGDGDSLSNSEAAKVYHMETERGVGLVKRLLIGPHTQYRMDLRGVTVPQVRSALAAFLKQLNDWKSQQNPQYEWTARQLSMSKPVEYMDRHGLFMAFTMEGRGTVKLITTYWKGQRDQKVPSKGCPVDYSYDRRHASGPTYQDTGLPIDARVWAAATQLRSEIDEFRNPPWIESKRGWKGLRHDFYRQDIDERESKKLWNYMTYVNSIEDVGLLNEAMSQKFEDAHKNASALLQRLQAEAESTHRKFKAKMVDYIKANDGLLNPKEIYGTGLTSGQAHDTLRHMVSDGLLKWDRARKGFTLK